MPHVPMPLSSAALCMQTHLRAARMRGPKADEQSPSQPYSPTRGVMRWTIRLTGRKADPDSNAYSPGAREIPATWDERFKISLQRGIREQPSHLVKAVPYRQPSSDRARGFSAHP